MGPSLIALAVPLFFLGMAWEGWAGRRRGVRVFRTGDALADVGCGVAQQLVALLVSNALVLEVYQAVHVHRIWTLPGAWLPWVGAVVGVELAYYWWHRLSHEVNLLWAAHVVHHQSEDYNLAVALRQSVLTWATTLPFYLPLALLGIPPIPFAVVLSLSTLYQFWIHTELVPALPAFERWFNSPALHRVHHAINPGYLDKNHAATFSWLDRLFGTFQPEGDPCVYGTTRPLRSFNPLWAQVETGWRLFRNAARAPSPGEGWRLLWRSPAWRPEWLVQLEPGVSKALPREKYDPPVSPAVARYAVGQWVVVVSGTFALLMLGRELPAVVRAGGVAATVAALLTLPGLVEGRPWARPAEAARVAVTVLGAGSWWCFG
jgi:alkylglycerol monooxygenase